jgi:hypothetical protein
MPKSELDAAIDLAVESYIVSKTRNQHTREGTIKTVDLDKTFPGYYKRMPNGHFFFIGKTADEVLEEYLTSRGYEVGCVEWYYLAEIVIERGEDGYLSHHRGVPPGLRNRPPQSPLP